MRVKVPRSVRVFRPGWGGGSGLGQDAGGDVSTIDLSSLPTSTISPSDISLPPLDTSTGGGFNLQNLTNLIGQAANTAVGVYRETQAPSLVPGTSAIYNAATGQFYNPVTGQVVAPGTGGVPLPVQTLAAGLPAGTIGLLAVVGIGLVLVMSMKR